MTNQRALGGAVVFGGAGFIGTHLLRELAEQGVTPLVSVDVVQPTAPVEGVEYVRGDVRQPLEHVAGEFAVAYNLAALHRTPGHPDAEYYDTNVLGALHVTAFCRERGIDEIVFTSSIAVYGSTEQQLDESSALTPTIAYGKSKLIAEAIHRVWLEERDGRRLVVVRPAVTFGPGEGGNFERLLRGVQRKAFVYPGRRDTIKSCGHVTDLVGSIAWARTLPDREITYNFAYPERTTIEAIATTIAATAGLSRPTRTAPLRAMLGAARAVEAVRPLSAATGVNRARVMKLVESTNVFPKVLVDRGYPFRTDLRSGVTLWLAETGVASGGH